MTWREFLLISFIVAIVTTLFTLQTSDAATHESLKQSRRIAQIVFDPHVDIDARRKFFSQYDFLHYDIKNQLATLLVDEEDLPNLQVNGSRFYSDIHIFWDYTKGREEQRRRLSSRSGAPLDPGQKVLSYEEVISYLEMLSYKYQHFTLNITGYSYQGRPLIMGKIRTPTSRSVLLSNTTLPNNKKYVEKPIIFLNSGIHAREWLGVSSIMHLVTLLLEGYANNDSRIRDLLDKYEIQTLPIMNPDGYVYTFKTSRMWRKNRRWVKSCHGVDLNRNFPTGYFSDIKECNVNSFSGEGPLSEAETQSLHEYLLDLKGKLAIFFDIHTFGELWLLPYGFMETKPRNFQRMKEISLLACDAIQTVRGRRWTVGTAFDLIPYSVSGIVIDWVIQENVANYAFGLELSPSFDSILQLGLNPIAGFTFDPSDSLHSAEELKEALLKLGDEISSEWYEI